MRKLTWTDAAYAAATIIGIALIAWGLAGMNQLKIC